MSSHFFLAHRLQATALPHRLRTMRAMTLIGIAIAVAALALALSIVRGFERAYKQSLLDFNAHLVLMVVPGTEEEMSSLPERIDAPALGVTGMTPFLYREGMVIGGGKIKGVVMKGVDFQSLDSVNGMKMTRFVSRPSIERGGLPSVILGKALAEHLGIADAPAVVQCLLPARPGQPGKGAAVPLQVIGTFESGLYDFDADFLLMPLDDLRKLFSLGEAHLTGWEVKLDDPDRVAAVVAQLKELLPPQVEAIAWDELNQDLFAALALEKIIFTLIMGILLLVAVFNIVAVMILTILFRRKEIAILRSLGLSMQKLRRMLTWNGVVLAFIGVAAGSAAAFSIALLLIRFPIITIDPEIYFIRFLPLDFSIPLCGIIAAFCLSVAWIASSLAASRLSSLPAVEGLNHSS